MRFIGWNSRKMKKWATALLQKPFVLVSSNLVHSIFVCVVLLKFKFLTNTIILAGRSGNRLMLRNDFIEYGLTISTGTLFVTPYATRWVISNKLYKFCNHINVTLDITTLESYIPDGIWRTYVSRKIKMGLKCYSNMCRSFSLKHWICREKSNEFIIRFISPNKRDFIQQNISNEQL